MTREKKCDNSETTFGPKRRKRGGNVRNNILCAPRSFRIVVLGHVSWSTTTGGVNFALQRRRIETGGLAVRGCTADVSSSAAAVGEGAHFGGGARGLLSEVLWEGSHFWRILCSSVTFWGRLIGLLGAELGCLAEVWNVGYGMIQD